MKAIEVIKTADPAGAKAAVAARVNGVAADLLSEVSDGDQVEAVVPPSREALEIYRHSTAHLLAAAVVELFPETKLGSGPPLLDDPKGGFFYDFHRAESFTPDDLAKIEKRMRELVKANAPFTRIEMPKAEALDRFGHDEFKCHFIGEKGDEIARFYTLGDHFIDFCRGPHLPSAGRIKAFKLLSVAGAHWLGDEKGKPMQRIYGTSFFTQDELDAWVKQREEAERRDHRRLGRELDLFSIQEEYGQGLIFWHPKGGIVRKELEDFLRDELIKRGYGLVVTPHLAKRDLWFTSGHEENYADSMFAPVTLDDQEYRIKPMNCPFHIGIYKSQQRSYRDLPLRYAEFGTVYRGELSGVVQGLFRVRGFTQDDAHLFCTPETVEQEIAGCVDFAEMVYRTFGFDSYKVELSVRDEHSAGKYLGSDEDWKRAEAALAKALQMKGIGYVRVEGEAAFYGPKIDIKVVDAIGRLWQLSTVQFDFNLPERFQLEYIDADNRPHRPLMLHRALFGSFERFFGILIEHYEGKFPAWLAPVQAIVLPIADRHLEYAEKVAAELRGKRLRVDVDRRSEKIGNKIRHAQLQKIPFMLVVGDREAEEGKVAVRDRRQGDTGSVPVAEFAERLLTLVRDRTSE